MAFLPDVVEPHAGCSVCAETCSSRCRGPILHAAVRL